MVLGNFPALSFTAVEDENVPSAIPFTQSSVDEFDFGFDYTFEQASDENEEEIDNDEIDVEFVSNLFLYSSLIENSRNTHPQLRELQMELLQKANSESCLFQEETKAREAHSLVSLFSLLTLSKSRLVLTLTATV
jgi:hypothetical protein